MIEYNSFLGNIKALEILDSRVNKNQHRYLIQEDLLAYYFARKSTNDETLDLIVLKSNRLLNTNLKLSSFKFRISNMNFDIYGKGNKNNSEQGRNLAKYLNKLIVNNNLDLLTLKNYINKMYNENIL